MNTKSAKKFEFCHNFHSQCQFRSFFDPVIITLFAFQQQEQMTRIQFLLKVVSPFEVFGHQVLSRNRSIENVNTILQSYDILNNFTINYVKNTIKQVFVSIVKHLKQHILENLNKIQNSLSICLSMDSPRIFLQMQKDI